MIARLGIIAAGVLALLVLGAVLFGGPIVKYWQQRTADAEATTEQQTDAAVGSGLEAAGTKEVADAAGTEQAEIGQIRGAIHALEIETRRDPATATRLPPGELARLREHDRSLCDSGIVRCDGRPAAAAGSAAPGAGGVQPLDVAGE